MEKPSEDVVTFLGTSPARVVTLETLTDGPKSRAELQATVDTSRTTLWRQLGELEERNWIRETDGEYTLTVAGRIVLERTRALRDAAAAVDELGDLLDFLPVDEMGFPIERLTDATVVRPTATNSQAPMRLATKQMEAATDIQILTSGYSPWIVEVLHEPVLRGQKSVSMVVTPGVLESMADEAAIRRQTREMLESGSFDAYEAGSRVPHVLAILDGERLGMGITDEQGRPQAVLDIEDDTVLEWALSTYGQYRAAATTVGADRFSD